MKTLLDGTPGGTYTVRKVTGGREIRARLEAVGVMSGADITLLSGGEDGKRRVRAGQRETYLTDEECALIGIEKLFTREGDPVLLGGCCSGGLTSELWDRMNGGPESGE